MKKIGMFLLLVVMMVSVITPTWATASKVEEKIKSAQLSNEITATGLPLSELLTLLSKQSGIRIIPVPEVADLPVDVQLTSNQTLEEALEMVAVNYGLTFQIHEQQNMIVMVKGVHITRARKETLYSNGAEQLQYRMRMDVSMPMSANYAMGTAGIIPKSYPAPTVSSSEEYQTIYDNKFQNAQDTPLSTFSIDVDTASYSNLRRFINSGKLPPVDAVRTEEMINYFTYDYPQPRGEQPFAVTTEMGDCPWQPQHKVVMIGLQGRNIPASELPPSNLVFLIDVSGSMSGEKRLPLLKTTFKMLVKQLREQDQVSIVVYAGQAGVVLEPTAGSEKAKITAAIDKLTAGGSTAGGEGIQLAYKIAKEHFIKDGNNRVILATDGDFNVGVSSEGELTKLIEERRADGISLSVLGFGMGNTKDNKMEILTDKGNGNYAYIDNVLEAKKSMVSQLAGTLYTIANDVKLQVEFNPAKVKSYRLIGYENRVLDKADFNNDQKDAGEMGAGHSVTALYEIVPVGVPEVGGKVDPLVYQQSKLVPSDELLQVKIRYKKPTADASLLVTTSMKEGDPQSILSENYRFATAVAEYAMLLRNSEYKGQASYQQVVERARVAKGNDPEGYRAEFIKLVECSQLFEEK